MLEKILAELDAAQRELEAGVFRHAPADWAAFVDRFGQWKGIEVARDVIRALIRDEDDREKDL